MTVALKGRSVDTARRLFKAVQGLCTGKLEAAAVKADMPEDVSDSIDSLAALSGVRQFPVRVKCATLSWHTMNAALHEQEKVSTE